MDPDPAAATPGQAQLLKADQIREDFPCFTCGYNLRTLTSEDRCPECGRPVSEALGAMRFRNSDPLWVASTRIGITLLLAWTCVLTTAGLLSVVSLSMDNQNAILGEWFLQLVYFQAALLGIGALLVSRAEPGAVTHGISVRRCVFLLAIGVFAFDVSPVIPVVSSFRFPHAIAWSMLLSHFLRMALMATLLWHLTRFARRARDSALSTHLPICGAILTLSVLLASIGTLAICFDLGTFRSTTSASRAVLLGGSAYAAWCFNRLRLFFQGMCLGVRQQHRPMREAEAQTPSNH